MEPIVLIFSDPNELRFISENLKENFFEVINTNKLSTALQSIKETNPSLVVISVSDKENEISLFLQELRKLNIKSLSLSEPGSEELHKNNSRKSGQYVAPPLRPKLLLSLIRGIINEEQIDWLPVAHT